MRAIAALVEANLGDAFTVEDICREAFPGARRIEKKHRVSVLRAMRSFVRQNDDWAVVSAQTLEAGMGRRDRSILLRPANLSAAIHNLRRKRIRLYNDWESFYLIRDEIDPHWREHLDG